MAVPVATSHGMAVGDDVERRRGGSWLGSLGWSLGHTVLALLALLVSLPLWLVPPLVLVLGELCICCLHAA